MDKNYFNNYYHKTKNILFKCDCGKWIKNKRNLHKHYKTKVHQRFLENGNVWKSGRLYNLEGNLVNEDTYYLNLLNTFKDKTI